MMRRTSLSLSDYCKEAKNLTESPIKDLCNLLNVYNDYVTWYGGSCDSECVFGATASGAPNGPNPQIPEHEGP
jgi:hypothetical protein